MSRSNVAIWLQCYFNTSILAHSLTWKMCSVKGFVFCLKKTVVGLRSSQRRGNKNIQHHFSSSFSPIVQWKLKLLVLPVNVELVLKSNLVQFTCEKPKVNGKTPRRTVKITRFSRFVVTKQKTLTCKNRSRFQIENAHLKTWRDR